MPTFSAVIEEIPRLAPGNCFESAIGLTEMESIFCAILVSVPPIESVWSVPFLVELLHPIAPINKVNAAVMPVIL
ncbi:hypothetical protein D3C80_1620930 [compost metagenome]